MIERPEMLDVDLWHVADNWQAEWIEVHDALQRALIRLEQERSDAEGLRDELEAQTAQSLTTWVADKMLKLGWASPALEEEDVMALREELAFVKEHWVNPKDVGPLYERIRLLEQAQTLLCDVVNQACQEDYDDKGPIIGDWALSAYEDAIDWLEKMGLAIRIPGKLLRWRLTWPESPAAEKEGSESSP